MIFSFIHYEFKTLIFNMFMLEVFSTLSVPSIIYIQFIIIFLFMLFKPNKNHRTKAIFKNNIVFGENWEKNPTIL